MNRQEMFNQVAAHLLTQRKKAGYTDNGGKFVCLYRDSNGCKCAIGALIPDDKYSPDMEGGGVSWNFNRASRDSNGPMFPVFREIVNPDDLKFATQLQYIHDQHEPNVWKDCLLVFGEAYGLHTELVSGYDKIS